MGLRALAKITDLPVRAGAVRARALRDPDAFVAELEDELAGPTPSRDVLLACAVWLLGDEGESHVPDLRRRAEARALRHVAELLADAPARKSLPPGARLPDVGIAEASLPRRVLHLPEFDHDAGPLPESFSEWTEWIERYDATKRQVGWSSLALPRRSVRREIGRFLRHPSAFTIRRLLDDRRVTRADVVAIAARRPTTPELVRAITSSVRWLALPDVRAALVANPFTPSRTVRLLAVTLPARSS